MGPYSIGKEEVSQPSHRDGYVLKHVGLPKEAVVVALYSSWGHENMREQHRLGLNEECCTAVDVEHRVHPLVALYQVYGACGF